MKLAEAVAAISRIAHHAARALLSAALWFCMLTAAGTAMLVAGVFVLAGLGWALIAGGVLCAAAAMFVLKGMTRG